MSRDKRSSAAVVDAFFEGVDEMRAHLDRRIQDPEHRRARLARLAGDLLRHAKPDDFPSWLLHASREALGADGAALYLRAGELGPTHELQDGHVDAFAPPLEARHEPHAGPRSLWLPLSGADGPIGGLWLTGLEPLDPGSLELLDAVIGSAAALLEHQLRLGSLTQDSATGLPNEATFFDAARRQLQRRADP